MPRLTQANVRSLQCPPGEHGKFVLGLPAHQIQDTSSSVLCLAIERVDFIAGYAVWRRLLSDFFPVVLRGGAPDPQHAAVPLDSPCPVAAFALPPR